MEPPFLAKSKIDRYTKATVVGNWLVLDFMEPSLPSSYKKALALSLPTSDTERILVDWQTLGTIEHDAEDQKLHVFNKSRRGQRTNGRGLEIFARTMRAFFNRTLLWLILDPPLISVSKAHRGSYKNEGYTVVCLPLRMPLKFVLETIRSATGKH